MPSIDWFIVLEVLYIVVVVLVCLRIIYETRSSTKTVAYLLLTIFVPFLGIILYFSVGMNYRNKSMYSKKLISNQHLQERLQQEIFKTSYHALHLLGEEGQAYKGLTNMVLRDMMSPLTSGNQIKILINGEETFPEMIRVIQGAKEHIHLEFYAFEDDQVGNAIKDVLIRKAREGVAVRFIYDHFGSSSIEKKMAAELKEAGVQIFPFHKINFLLFANRINYRNHRKILVVDGYTSFVGGLNIADRYDNNGRYKTYWRDTHMRIDGPGTLYLQYIFLCDWNFCSNEKLMPERRFFKDIAMKDGGGMIQIVSSGPDSPSPSILYCMLDAINTAKEELLITTPYFIPGESLMDALIIAARRGVKVKLLVPYVSDSRFVNAAAHSYYHDLLLAGVRIFRYKKGFVHAKTMVCDQMLAIVGTANMDQRSFDLNFEVIALVFDPEAAKKLHAVFYEDLKGSEELNPHQWANRATWRKLMEKTARMLSPLL